MDIITIVPAYKPKYLVGLLKCLRLQTRLPKKIIFSDDSPNGVYRKLLMSEELSPLRNGLHIECINGPQRGGYHNILHLLDYWNESSDLLHVMLDDDGLYPTFYDRHLVAHQAANFSCTISRRWSADDDGQPITCQPIPAALVNHPNRLIMLDADVTFMSTVADCKNWLGEFSNAVFRLETVKVFRQPMFAGVSYCGLWDLGAFLAASLNGNIGYIQENLGFFRTSGDGNSSNFFGPYMKAAHLGFVALCLGGWRLGRYSSEQAKSVFIMLSDAIKQRYGNEEDMLPFIVLISRLAQGDRSAEPVFIEYWHTYLKLHDFYT
jgi:hypothetical protein